MPLPHILYFSTLWNWLRLLWKYGRQIDRGHRWRAVTITLFVIATVPVRLLESLLFSLAVRRHRIVEPPIFIIGHWRSGTTHLHNLLLTNPRFASVTMLHCAIPAGFLTWGWLARLILRRRLPKSRPMDAVPLGLDEPMSEDFALAGLTHMSHYVNYFFPRVAEQSFRETVLFDGVTDADRRNWRTQFLWLLRKVSWHCGGRRLLLKNPANTGRVAELLRLFPDAKFIHVVRDPFVVHASTMKLMDRFLAHLAFQSTTTCEIESFVMSRYVQLMERWFHDRGLIPAANLIEVRHEDVVAQPMETVAAICRMLGINIAEFEPRLSQHLKTIADYQPNEYAMSDEDRLRLHAQIGHIANRVASASASGMA